MIRVLLLELLSLDLLRNFVLYTWHKKVRVHATSSIVFKITISNLQQSKNIGRACAYRSQNSGQIFIASVMLCLEICHIHIA